MPSINQTAGLAVSRRRLLQQAGGTLGLLGAGSVSTIAAGGTAEDGAHCSEATFEPGMVHHDHSIHEVCSDEHPATEALQADVRASLESKYSTVGALIESGFIPYFDFATGGSWSHWINPTFIRDDSMVDPDRPESILVDHTWWRPIGVMFIATDGGDPVDPPPTVYEDGDENGGACTPWHAHVGFPGRYSWWKYRTIYHENAVFPCRTPWMMHVWIYPHQESIYAHAAPDERGGPPAEPPGFETDVDPNEEPLSLKHLPDILRKKTEDHWRV